MYGAGAKTALYDRSVGKGMGAFTAASPLIATWLSALAERFRSAPAALSFCAAVPSRTSATSGSMPPARAIATCLSWACAYVWYAGWAHTP